MSRSHAAAIAATQPEAEAEKIKKEEFVTAIDRLLACGRVTIDTLRPGTTRQKKVMKVAAH